jgi:hypothetical protein
MSQQSSALTMCDIIIQYCVKPFVLHISVPPPPIYVVEYNYHNTAGEWRLVSEPLSCFSLALPVPTGMYSPL